MEIGVQNVGFEKIYLTCGVGIQFQVYTIYGGISTQLVSTELYKVYFHPPVDPF